MPEQQASRDFVIFPGSVSIQVDDQHTVHLSIGTGEHQTEVGTLTTEQVYKAINQLTTIIDLTGDGDKTING